MKIAKGHVVREFMMITNVRQKYVNIGTFWTIKTEHLQTQSDAICTKMCRRESKHKGFIYVRT